MVVASVFLTACSSISESIKPQEPQNMSAKSPGLQPQNLGENECGVFLWTDANPRSFVFFQKQDEATAQFYNENTQTVSTTGVTSFFADAGKIELDYVNTADDKIKVNGAFDEEIEGGHRINTASITVIKADGWQQIIPTSGVFVCR